MVKLAIQSVFLHFAGKGFEVEPGYRRETITFEHASSWKWGISSICRTLIGLTVKGLLAQGHHAVYTKIATASIRKTNQKTELELSASERCPNRYKL